MKKYAIENTSGQWWTGTCWGVKQAREEYYDLEDMPYTIEDDLIDILCLDPLDARYFSDTSDDATASVREVK